MSDDLRKQVEQQCRVVEHMAKAIAEVHADKAEWLCTGTGGSDEVFLNMLGRWTAERMEILGDMLNGMDAVTEEDDWTHPIFDEALRRWPSSLPAGQSDAQQSKQRGEP